MTKKIRTVVFILFISFYFPVSGQLVREKFDKMTLSENFDSSTSMWTMVANLDNLFIVQDGEYILNRKTQVSPFAVVAGFNNESAVFRLVSSLKLEKTATEDGSAGLLFMAQDDGKGGFIFEINKSKQYRVKQITGGSYKYVSGEPKNNGWVKSNALSELNLYNLVDIRIADKNYDVYVNNTFLMSFTEPAYKTGKLGIIIGPGSKARVDFFYVFSSSRVSIPDPGVTAGADKTSGGEAAVQSPDIIQLAESIILLKTQINKANEDNEVLRHTIDAYKMDSKDAEANLRTYEKNIKVLQDELKKQNLRMDSLVKVNAELMKYKELVAGNENSDLIITLSKTVKSEKEANEELRRINKELSDSLAVMKNEARQAGQKQANKTPGSNSQATKSVQDTTSRKGFVLPNDGN